MILAKLEKYLFFLTIIFLPTQLGRHFWLQFSFVYSLPIDYLAPTLYFWDLLVAILLGIFVIQGKKLKRFALSLYLVFILCISLSLLFKHTFSIGVGLVRFEQYIIAGLFGVYIASFNFFKIRNLILWGLLLSILGESVLAIGQFIKAGSLGFEVLGERNFSLSTPGIAKFDLYGAEVLRPYATFSHPNVLAGFLVVTLLLLLFWKMKTVNKLATVLGSLVILLTVSRTSFVAGFGSAFFLLRKKGRIVLITLLLFLSPLVYTRLSTIFSFDSLTLSRREELSSVAFHLWLTSPIFGIGLNNFIPAGADQLLSGPSRFLQPVHNIFLLSLSETGLIGTLGLILLIGYPILKLIKLRTTNLPFGGPLSTILLLWTVILFLGMFDHYFLTLPQGYRLLFLIWGLSLSMLE